MVCAAEPLHFLLHRPFLMRKPIYLQKKEKLQFEMIASLRLPLGQSMFSSAFISQPVGHILSALARSPFYFLFFLLLNSLGGRGNNFGALVVLKINTNLHMFWINKASRQPWSLAGGNLYFEVFRFLCNYLDFTWAKFHSARIILNFPPPSSFLTQDSSLFSSTPPHSSELSFLFCLNFYL